MKSRKVDIFEFPTNLGLTKKVQDNEPGVHLLPTHLKQHGFYDKISPENIYRLDAPAYTANLDTTTAILNGPEVSEYAQRQSEILIPQLSNDSFKLIIGGDCSILLGTSLALKQSGNYALFFLDGHTDYILPSLSLVRAVAGMDLSIVTGYGHESLTNIGGLNPYFSENNVFAVGNRDYEEAFISPILKSAINYFSLDMLRTQGIVGIVDRFLSLVDSEALDGFLIHLDVDVLDDNIMPAVDSRAPGGLSYPELFQILQPLLESAKAVGLEIAIFDPSLDPENIYVKELVDFLGQFFPLCRISSKEKGYFECHSSSYCDATLKKW